MKKTTGLTIVVIGVLFVFEVLTFLVMAKPGTPVGHALKQGILAGTAIAGITWVRRSEDASAWFKKMTRFRRNSIGR